MAAKLTPLSIFAASGRTYLRSAPSLLLLAVAVFLPVSLLNAIAVEADIGELDLGRELELLAAAAAVLAIGLTGLIGEVFYTGAVAVSLTRTRDDRPLSLREIAGTIAYRRLIAVDLAYAVLVAVGLALLVAPGIAAFVWFALAAPIVEIERRGIRAAFVRSFGLVRGRFWTVLAVLLPLQLLDDGVAELATSLAHGQLGDSLPAEWLGDFLLNVVVTPFYAVAVVLLTVNLIAAKEAQAPPLHSTPVPA